MADSGHGWDVSSAGVTLIGAVLLVATAYHHIVRESAAIGQVVAPTAAFVLDGGLAVGVVAVGITMARSDRGREHRRTVAVFGAGTGLAFAIVVALTTGIRTVEGRTVPEPEFVLFTAVASGVLTGALAGEYRARSRAYARSAACGRDTLAFVNGMLRHDIRNDAAIIAGYADEIDDQETAAIVRDRAQQVIERLDLTRAVGEAVAGDADPDPRPLAPLVEEAVASATTAYPSATVTNEVPDGVAAAVTEAISPVLDNLIENAIEHQDGDATVRVDAERDGDRVRLRVLDDGPGINAETREELFDHDVGSATGLHVVDTIVDGLGGDVRVETREPRGTAFVVTLPASASDRVDEVETESTPPRSYAAGDRRDG